RSRTTRTSSHPSRLSVSPAQCVPSSPGGHPYSRSRRAARTASRIRHTRGYEHPHRESRPHAGHARAGRRQLGRVGLWTGSLEGVRAAEIPDLLADLEAQGWPTLWFGEAVGREAFTAAQLYLS